MTQDEGIDLTNFDKEKEIAKFKDIEPQGWTVVIRLYTDTKVKNGIYMTDTIHDDQQYKSCVGLVVAKSKAAYKDMNRYEQTGDWCEIGDWVVFPRHSGYKIHYDGLPVFVLKEDAIDLKINDPLKVMK